jgi:ubiquinone biosynthesis protein
VIDEFVTYTLREADLGHEADHAETFAANFRDEEAIVFPRIHPELSTRDLLTMELLEGIQPSDARALALRKEERERLVSLGAEAIVGMLFRDGFFHADLHPANLLILPGPKVGFVDLGIVGRFDADLKRALLYYYYCVVNGDVESAAGYLAAIAQPGSGADPAGFRRDVEETSRQWLHRARFTTFSLGRLVLQSVAHAAHRRMYFPVEMVLMVKALVTFEAVGQRLLPGFDVARVSRPHIHRILLERFAPSHLAQESLTAIPELADAVAKVPRLVIEGLQLVEKATRRPAENPLAGLRASLFGGSCLVAGAVLIALEGPWPLGAALLVLGALVALRRA